MDRASTVALAIEALLVLANAYLVSGRTKEGAPLIERLTELDPLSPLSQCMLVGSPPSKAGGRRRSSPTFG